MPFHRLLRISLALAIPLAADVQVPPGGPFNVTSPAVPLSSLPNPSGPGVRAFSATFTNVTEADPWVTMILNVWPQVQNSCKIHAHGYLGVMTLWTDEGGLIAPVTESWINPLDPSSAPFHENCSCRVYRSGSSVDRNNTTVTLTLSVEIREPFSGIRYSYAIGGGGGRSWAWHNWTVHGANYLCP